MKEFDCIDCGVNTSDIEEYYMVHDDVWPVENGGGMLCVGCLEQRIGRRLTSADFTAAPVNHHRCFWKSGRLISRIHDLQ